MGNTVPSRYPAAVHDQLARLGGHLAIARKRRGLTQAELAKKAGLGRVTVHRIEQGSSGAEFGAWLSLLWALGLERTADLLAAPESDDVGLTLERGRLPQRARGPAAKDLDDAF